MSTVEVTLHATVIGDGKPVPTVQVPDSFDDENLGKLCVAVLRQYGQARLRLVDGQTTTVTFDPMFVVGTGR